MAPRWLSPLQREALARLRRAAAGRRQARLLRGLRAWGKAAAATAHRQHLVRGAVQQRFPHAGLETIAHGAPRTTDGWARIEAAAQLARAWESWRQRARRRPSPLTSEQLAAEAGRVARMRDAALKNGDVQTALSLGSRRRALQRLRWPRAAEAIQCWARGARVAARERAVRGRVSAALLHRHAAPALHTWAHACRRRGARRAAARVAARGVALKPTGAADERALRAMTPAAYTAARRLFHAPRAKALRTMRAATDATRRARELLQHSVNYWRHRAEGRAMRTWACAAAARGARLSALRLAVALLRNLGASRAMAAWRACASERVRAVARRRRLQAALRGGRLRYIATWRAAAAERKARVATARRCAAAMVLREVGAALRSWREASAARAG